MDNPVSIRLESPESIKKISLGSLQGAQLQREVRTKAKFIGSLIGGQHRHLLNDQGYMLMINGSWGIGKTVTANALINHLKTRYRDSLVDIRTETFLPFGNVNESITNFLNTFARELWEQNIVDIRKDIQQFVLEATPGYEINSQVSLSAGPFSASKTWKRNSMHLGSNEVYRQLGALQKKHKTIIVMVDDIDRLAPDEMLAVLRMIEKVRRLPRVIVVVPVFKKVLANAIGQELGLNDPGASNNFLRKLTDSEIRLTYGVNEIKQVFISEFHEYKDIEVGKGYPKLPEFCWYVLLHSLILNEALDLVRDQSVSGANVDMLLRDIYDNKSTYIASLVEKIKASVQNGSVQHYPTHTVFGPNQQLSWLGELYQELRTYPNIIATNDMEKLTQTKYLFRDILFGSEAHSAVEHSPNVDWNNLYKSGQDVHFFQAISLPLLKQTRRERFLTDNYGMRDIKTIAREIQQHRFFKLEHVSPQLIYTIVSKAFVDLRF